jgi:radical SAM protein with 4Fe4S-binding SPASM domain
MTAEVLVPRRRSLPIAQPSRRPALDNEARDIDRLHRPNYAVWEVTLACDLACCHCGSRAGRARPDELSTQEALDLVDQMADLGVKELSLIGGEAYLRDDWLDIVRRSTERGILCQMTTGARGLTRDRLLAARDAGLRSVSISVDGFEQTHDKQRGVKGSFASVKRTFADLREIGGLRITANTQVNKLNLREIEPLYAWLIEQGIVAWQVQLTAAMGRAADEQGILLEPYQVLETHPMLVRAKQYGDARKVRMWSGNNVGYFGPFEHILRGDWVATHRGSCGAGRRTLGIEANGDIKGCPSLPTAEFVGGNVRDYKLVDIWERSTALRFTRDMNKTKLGGYCAECYYAEDCFGGCHWTASVLVGKIGDNPYCHHRAYELLKKGERERIELEQAAPGMPFDHAIYRIVREKWPTEASQKRALEITETGQGFLDEA